MRIPLNIIPQEINDAYNLTVRVDCQGWIYIVRIPVSLPYVEVRMDTSGTYALVKARTDTSRIYTPTRHTGHTHTLHVTYRIDKDSLRAQFTRYVHNLQAHFMRAQFTCPIYAYNLRARVTCTIYAPILRVQSMRLTYAMRHVIRLSLVRTYYTT